MSSNNEYAKIYGERWEPRAAWTWRRFPDVPEWQVYVKFGDDGYECDPGVYGESIDSAIEQVARAAEELADMLGALKAFKTTGKVKSGD